jgi:hypothetical protein
MMRDFGKYIHTLAEEKRISDEESGKILKSPDTVNPKPPLAGSQSFHAFRLYPDLLLCKRPPPD